MNRHKTIQNGRASKAGDSCAAQRISRGARAGFSLMEVIAALSIATAMAVTIVPRLVQPADDAKADVCSLQQARLDLEISLWRYANGDWPASLADVTNDAQRFPEGSPTCPITNLPYQLPTDRQRVIPHNH